MSASRPASMALMPLASNCASPTAPPSLRDILFNTAAPPYTLAAFMAFLSQNHCLETLEFTMDADRYRAAHADLLHPHRPITSGDANEHVCSLWQKLMHAYILPCGYREVNLPAHVRDRLLSLPSTPHPPQPSELDEAVTIVYELMNDSVLGPFIASVAAPSPELMEDGEARLPRLRHRMHKEGSTVSNMDESVKSPKVGFLPLLNISWTNSDHAHRSGSSSGEAAEPTGLSDDTGSTGSPSANEPMTPPTTPPTSDWAFGTSPGSLQRAFSAHNSWRHLGLKLGLGKKSRTKRAHTTSASAGSDHDLYMHDAPPGSSHSNNTE